MCRYRRPPDAWLHAPNLCRAKNSRGGSDKTTDSQGAACCTAAEQYLRAHMRKTSGEGGIPREVEPWVEVCVCKLADAQTLTGRYTVDVL